MLAALWRLLWHGPVIVGGAAQARHTPDPELEAMRERAAAAQERAVRLLAQLDAPTNERSTA